MKTIIITDTHFGIKQNSITWLNSQIDFIKKQLLPYIKQYKKEDVRLVHLGDVFDSRSSISTLIATRVVEIFTELYNNVSEFIIIGGNHDYYSPNSDQIDTINLVLGDIGINIVTKSTYKTNQDLFVPWFCWEDILKGNIPGDVKRIFAHTDIVTEQPNITGVDIYSGHMHTPCIRGRYKNLGSCFYLTFNDATGIRGFYELGEDDVLKFIENTTSIRFWRLYDSNILKDTSYIDKDDYVELYVSQENLLIKEYNDKIQEIGCKVRNCKTIPNISQNIKYSEEDISNYDIDSMIELTIPDHLKNKFKTVKDNANLY